MDVSNGVLLCALGGSVELYETTVKKTFTIRSVIALTAGQSSGIYASAGTKKITFNAEL